MRSKCSRKFSSFLLFHFILRVKLGTTYIMCGSHNYSSTSDEKQTCTNTNMETHVWLLYLVNSRALRPSVQMSSSHSILSSVIFSDCWLLA